MTEGLRTSAIAEVRNNVIENVCQAFMHRASNKMFEIFNRTQPISHTQQIELLVPSQIISPISIPDTLGKIQALPWSISTAKIVSGDLALAIHAQVSLDRTQFIQIKDVIENGVFEAVRNLE